MKLRLLFVLAMCAIVASSTPRITSAQPAHNNPSHATMGNESTGDPCAGSIAYWTDYRVGREYWAQPERDGMLGTGCGYMVLTGVGANIVHDSNYATLWLTGRMVYSDGTMSTATTRVEGDGWRTPEAMLEVPYGHAIVGIGAGQSGTHDLKTLVLKYRQVQVVDGRLQLVGPVYTMQTGSGSLNSMHQLPEYNDREVYIGVGFRSSVEQTKLILAHTGVLY
jgi:hypothetical protein